MGDNKKKYLLIGWTLGPFLVVGLLAVIMASLSWPQTTNIFGKIVGWVISALPISTGLICLIAWLRPKGITWLLLIPYVISYFVFSTGLWIIVAIALGASK
jgi:hypothetical protein